MQKKKKNLFYVQSVGWKTLNDKTTWETKKLFGTLKGILGKSVGRCDSITPPRDESGKVYYTCLVRGLLKIMYRNGV